MLKWSTKWRWHTGYSADSVEWCPVEPYRHVLVCGTYQLDKGEPAAQETKQKRLGKIYLFTIDHKTTELTPIQTIETSGVLDQKWCYHLIGDHPILAVATSEGEIQLYRLVQNEALSLELYINFSIGQDILELSLDWSTNKTNGDAKIVVSDSAGNVMVFKLVKDGLEKLRSWRSHSYEAWIAAFNYWDTNVFYSGGDDCVFKSYDVRVAEAVTTNRTHEAGVTAVRSHVDVEHQFLTGSYDEKIRLWDARCLQRCLVEKNVNGGVWRLKYHPYRPNVILAACMYGGFRIVQAEKLDVLCEYMEHESIAYGADWKFDEKLPLVATCSFYDCKLHVSEVTV